MLLVILASAAARAQSTPVTLLYLNAKSINFYYDRFLLEADGNVRLRTSDGFTVTGDSFSMDLKLNRFLLAGHVTLHDRSGTVSGAAISDFLDFKRIYFVPVTTQPDRWTFLNGDLAHPAMGRVMPGDAFYFPPITTQPDMTGTGAVIGTKTYVRFIGAVAYVAGVGVPLGSNVVSFSSNQYFAQNSLSGATADITWQVAGSPNALTALHLRYDPTHDFMGPLNSISLVIEYADLVGESRDARGEMVECHAVREARQPLPSQSFTQYYAQQNYLQLPRAAQQTTWITPPMRPHSYVTAHRSS